MGLVFCCRGDEAVGAWVTPSLCGGWGRAPCGPTAWWLAALDGCNALLRGAGTCCCCCCCSSACVLMDRPRCGLPDCCRTGSEPDNWVRWVAVGTGDTGGGLLCGSADEDEVGCSCGLLGTSFKSSRSSWLPSSCSHEKFKASQLMSKWGYLGSNFFIYVEKRVLPCT